MSPNWGGIIIVTNIQMNKTFFPLKCNFAKAYPAKEQRNNTPIVVNNETIREFHIAPKKSIVFNTFVKLVTNSLPGTIAGGTLFITLLLLVAATNIQYKGKIDKIEAIIRVT